MSDTIILTPELDEVIAPQSGITGMARRAAASTRPFLGNRSFRRMRQFEPDHSIVCVQFIGDFPALFFFSGPCAQSDPRPLGEGGRHLSGAVQHPQSRTRGLGDFGTTRALHHTSPRHSVLLRKRETLNKVSSALSCMLNPPFRPR